METLQDKIAIVTGASGAIGRVIVERLHREGATVILSARRLGPLEEVAAALEPQERFEVLPGDAAEWDQAQAVVTQTVAKYGGLDLVVIASGGYEPLKLGQGLEEASAVMDKLININLRAAFNIAWAAAAVMKEQRRGVIINISSHAATKVLRGGFAYGATKAAAYTLMLHLANELAPFGVRIFDIQPSTVNTPGRSSEFIPAGKGHLAVQPEDIAERVIRLFQGGVDVNQRVEQPIIGRLPNF